MMGALSARLKVRGPAERWRRRAARDAGGRAWAMQTRPAVRRGGVLAPRARRAPALHKPLPMAATHTAGAARAACGPAVPQLNLCHWAPTTPRACL
jgi:hypothetical protein